MDSPRLLRLTLSLLTGAAVLVALPLNSSGASATPAVCTTTYSAPPVTHQINAAAPNDFTVSWIDIQVPDQRVVVDVDVAFDVSFSVDSSRLEFTLHSPQTVGQDPKSVASGTTGPLAGSFVLDDEAATPFTSVSPPSGRYRPAMPLSALEGRPAVGQWRVLAANASPHAGTWRNITLTLTVDCDADKDGFADDMDNCLVIANDQTNRDGDALGDACDLDIDGDSLANTVDGCPLAPAATTSGCPKARRTAKIGVTKAGKRLKFMVRSRTPGCVSGAEITLWRARRGKDIKVMAATTTKRGRYTTKAPRQAGKYYFRVTESYAAGEAECGKAKSTTTKVRR